MTFKISETCIAARFILSLKTVLFLKNLCHFMVTKYVTVPMRGFSPRIRMLLVNLAQNQNYMLAKYFLKRNDVLFVASFLLEF